MAEYIEREKLEKAFDDDDPDVCESYPDGYSDWGFGRKNIRDVIRSVPAADVDPVVQGRETREGGSTMGISECIDRGVKARWRADLVNMLTDAGRTLEHTALRINGSVYQNINVGMLLLEAARSLKECQDEAEPEKPGDVGVKVTVTVPDQQEGEKEGERIRAWLKENQKLSLRKLWEAGANQIDSTKYGNLENCAAAWKPVTNGDRIRAMTDEELADSDFSEVICDDIPRCLLGGVDTCRECRIKWLGSPVKEENDE